MFRLGKKIQSLRREKGFKNAGDFALASKINESSIRMIESDRQLPTLNQLRKIVIILDVSYERIIGRANQSDEPANRNETIEPQNSINQYKIDVEILTGELVKQTNEIVKQNQDIRDLRQELDRCQKELITLKTPTPNLPGERQTG